MSIPGFKLPLSMDEMGMLEKIMQDIHTINTQIVLINERSDVRHDMQLEILKDMKEIKEEINLHREKIDDLISIKNFIFTNWWKLLLIAMFVFSSVELHKFIHLAT